MNWLALIPALIALALRLIPGPRIVDDAYITFRYATNLTAGHGLVFNPGELVLGTTTPLYTLLLASLSAVLGSDDLPRIAWLLNAAVDAVGVTLVYRLGNKLSGNRLVGIGAALLWAMAPFSVSFAVGGLETSVAITLLLAAFATYLNGRDNWCALLVALGVLTRPDVLIAGLLLFGFMGWRWLQSALSKKAKPDKTPFPIQPALIFVGTLLPWLVYATITYGSPLPHSMAAKSVAYRLGAEEGLVRFMQHLATPFHEHLLFRTRWVLVGLFLYSGLFAVGAFKVTRQHPRALPLVLYPHCYTAVYALANPLIFRWYLSPPVPFYFLGILCGCWALSTAIAQPKRQNPRFSPPSLILAVIIALASFSSLHAWTAHPPGPPDRTAPEMAWIELETLYQQVALDLKDELATSGSRLAAGDIGTLGWYTGAPILDLVGLVSPQSKDYYPLPAEAYVINYAVSTDYVLAERPEFVVILEVYGRNTLSQDPDFASTYELWGQYPTDIYGSTAMQVFRLAN